MRKIILIGILIFLISISLFSSATGVNINPPTSATSPSSATGVNINPPTSPRPISNTTSSNFLNGSVIFSDGINLAEDNDNFFWNDINNRLGIGLSAPQRDFHISSAVPTFRFSDSNAATDQAVATLIEFYRGDNDNRVGFLAMASASNDIMALATDYVGGTMAFRTGSNTDAITIDSSQVTTFKQDIIMTDDKFIRTGTSDGSDDESTGISGGGALSNLRGSFVRLSGNEDGNTGRLFLTAGNVNGGTIRMSTGGSSRMEIDKDGNVGIGTTSPTHTLNVVGDANITGDIFSNSYQVISYQRTVNIRNVTMTAVI